MIEPVSEANLQEVLPLIRKYQAFYQAADISDAKNAAFFAQFCANSSLDKQFAFRDPASNQIIAFATVYFTYTSTIAAKVAVLNDLFVQETHRRKGIGKQLIEHCHGYANENAATRLQWVTATDNVEAQKLYDAMPTSKSTWHFYSYKT